MLPHQDISLKPNKMGRVTWGKGSHIFISPECDITRIKYHQDHIAYICPELSDSDDQRKTYHWWFNFSFMLSGKKIVRGPRKPK